MASEFNKLNILYSEKRINKVRSIIRSVFTVYVYESLSYIDLGVAL